MRERERERESALAPPFIAFSSPWACPVQIGLSQPCCLFYLKSSLRSSDLPLFYFRFSLPCLWATALLDSSTFPTWCEGLTRWKSPWCWEGLGAGGEGDDGRWDGWMASPSRWAWVWVNSGSWWWTGRPGVLRSMGSQRVGHGWATELNWILDSCFLF